MKKTNVSWILCFLIISSLAPLQSVQAINIKESYRKQAVVSTFSNEQLISKSKGTYIENNRLVGLYDRSEINHIDFQLESTKDIYYVGESINISGYIRNGDTPLKNKPVKILISYNDEEIYEKTVKTTVNGEFIHFLPITLTSGSKHYQVTVTYDGFTETSEFMVKLKPQSDGEGVSPIEPITPKSEKNKDMNSFDPQLSSVYKWEPKLNVPVSKAWRVRFNTKMDRSTLNGNYLFIQDDKGNNVDADIDISMSSKEVIISPKAPLKHKQHYTLWIRKEVRNQESSLPKHIKLDFYTK